MNILRTLALGLWMAGLYRVIFYPEWGPLAGRGCIWLLAAWTFTLGLELCHHKNPLTKV